MKLIKFLTLLIIFVFISEITSAQESDIEMADVMRSNGKIYVVVAVVSVILLGFLIALINIDKKVRKLEKNEGKE